MAKHNLFMELGHLTKLTDTDAQRLRDYFNLTGSTTTDSLLPYSMVRQYIDYVHSNFHPLAELVSSMRVTSPESFILDNGGVVWSKETASPDVNNPASFLQKCIDQTHIKMGEAVLRAGELQIDNMTRSLTADTIGSLVNVPEAFKKKETNRLATGVKGTAPESDKFRGFILAFSSVANEFRVRDQRGGLVSGVKIRSLMSELGYITNVSASNLLASASFVFTHKGRRFGTVLPGKVSRPFLYPSRAEELLKELNLKYTTPSNIETISNLSGEE